MRETLGLRPDFEMEAPLRTRNIFSFSAILIVVLAMVAQATQAPNTDELVLVPIMVSDSKNVRRSSIQYG